jgi:nucleoside-diphosphate-sugar epimerase
MKVLVTGATGFVGSNLARRLIDEGHEVHITMRSSSSWMPIADIWDRVHSVTYDGTIGSLTGYLNGQQPFDAVFHVAARTGYDDGPVDEYIESNIRFGAHLLEAMARTGNTLFINTSTAWTHGQNHEYDPVCLYAATKAAYGKIIEYYVLAKGFRCVTLELYDVYGEYDTRPKLVHLLKRAADTEIPLETTPGEQPIVLTHIEDIVSGYIKAWEAAGEMPPAHRIYVLDADEVTTVRELIERMEKIWGVPIPVHLGAKPYREREVMALWERGERLPGWRPGIGLTEGLKRLRSGL